MSSVRTTEFKVRNLNTVVRFHYTPLCYRKVAQFGRARALGVRCRRFESCLSDAEKVVLKLIQRNSWLTTSNRGSKSYLSMLNLY